MIVNQSLPKNEHGQHIHAEHDEIWLAGDPTKLNPHHIEKLKELGFEWDEDHESFHTFV